MDKTLRQALMLRMKGITKQVAAFNKRNKGVRLATDYDDDNNIMLIYVRVHVPELQPEPSAAGSMPADDDPVEPVLSALRKLSVRVKSPESGGATDKGTHYIKISLNGFKAPVVSYLTANRIFHANVKVCIQGVTHFHEEDWNPATQLEHVINILLLPITSPDAVEDTFQSAIGSTKNPYDGHLPLNTPVPASVVGLFA